MKQYAKKLIAAILGWQVRRLVRKNDFKVIAIAGSIGKTSTKLAVAHLLSKKYKVRFQSGNYNDIVFIPLVFFDRPAPNIFNPIAWIMVFIQNELSILRKYTYEIVVAELGTDAPGQIIQFKKYINAELGILTSITPEHMANFKDIDAVASEELMIAKFSQQLLINKDLISEKYINSIEVPVQTYSLKHQADYHLTKIKFEGDEAAFTLFKGSEEVVSAKHSQITEPQLYSVAAAAAVAHLWGIDSESIAEGITTLPSVNGRMQHLKGIKNSTIIDDTYNASPEAVKAALDTIYRMAAPQKIAVLGNMNELGEYSKSEHIMIGDYCDPTQLDIVITIGPEANEFLSPAAKAKGCIVKSFDNPYSAGKYLKTVIKEGALILIKGSQNKVYAEETTKLILANPADSLKLVRQSPKWLKLKQKNFSNI